MIRLMTHENSIREGFKVEKIKAWLIDYVPNLPKDRGLKICFWNLGKAEMLWDSWPLTSWTERLLVLTKKEIIWFLDRNRKE